MPLEKEQFEAWWPEVARRVSRSLARRGVPAQDAEDIVQETALRALAAAPPVASQAELLRWSYTVARRIGIDRARRRGRSELLAAELASLRPTGTDTARAAEHRVALATAARGLASLSEADRTALLSVLDEAGAPAADRRAAVREAVRRHRARLRLVAAVGKLVGVGVAAAHALRRLAGRVRPAYAEAGLAAALAAGVVLLGPAASGPAAAAGLPDSQAAAPVAHLPGGIVPSATPPAGNAASIGHAPGSTSEATPAPASTDSTPSSEKREGRTITLPLGVSGGGGGGDGGNGDGGGPTLYFLLSKDSEGVLDGNEAIWCAYSAPGAECVDRSSDPDPGPGTSADDKFTVHGR